jgi:hypothetical protein
MPSWEALLTASWRAYPATAMILAGMAVAARGIYRERRELHRPPSDPGLGFALARALRGTLAGAALAGMGFGWLYALSSLVIVSALIWLEEMLEISSVLRVIRAGRQGGRPS